MGFMKPSTPNIPKPVEVPKKTDAEIGQSQEAEKQKRKLQKGRASTILSGAQGDDSSGLATKTLLGGN